MRLKAIKTKKFIPPRDSIDQTLKGIANEVKSRSIIAISSKIVSIHEGRTILVAEVIKKDELIKAESSKYLPREYTPGGWVMHTLTNNLLVPTAGIDESNANEYFILWPVSPMNSAKEIWKKLSNYSGIEDFGVIITDSHSIPLRRGVVGICLGYYGLNPLRDYRGEEDIFGRKLKISQSNIVDSIASACVLEMGEGAEQTPIAVVTDLPEAVVFGRNITSVKKEYSSLEVPMDEDLYYPFLSSVPWEKGGNK